MKLAKQITWLMAQLPTSRYILTEINIISLSEEGKIMNIKLR